MASPPQASPTSRSTPSEIPWVFATLESIEDLVRINPGFAGIHAQISAELIAAVIEALRNATEAITMEAHMAVATKV
jgi:hypothetical protein